MPATYRCVRLCVALFVALAGCDDSGDGDADAQNPTSSTAATSAPAPPASAATTATSAAPSTTAASPGIEVALSDGQVVGGTRKETVRLGDEVRIRATSDVAEVLHVHTYDLKTDLQPGVPGEVVFTANIPGRHEVEFEKSGKDALTLEVR